MASSPVSSHHSQPPPSSSSSDHHTTIVVVFVTCGGLFFLGFLVVGICYLIKKKLKKREGEAELIEIDGHRKVKEAIVEGPHGKESVVLEIVDDVHIKEGKIKGEEIVVGQGTKSGREIQASASGPNQRSV